MNTMMLNSISAVVLWLATWPYYWTLCHHTIKPIRRISRCTTDMRKLKLSLQLFRMHKDKELGFVMTASTLSAAANLSSLQWPITHDSPWAASALWFCSLLLSIFALILAAQQAVLLKLLPLPGTSGNDSIRGDKVDKTPMTLGLPSLDKNEVKALESTLRLFVRRIRTVTAPTSITAIPTGCSGGGTPTGDAINNIGNTYGDSPTMESQVPVDPATGTVTKTMLGTKTRATTSSTLVDSGRDSSHVTLRLLPLHSGIPDLNMMYIWQAPLMLMSWSWFSYLLGLTLWVASPALWPQIRYQDDKKVAFFYTACCAVICLNFGWCSLWAYRASAPAHSHLLDDDAFPEDEDTR